MKPSRTLRATALLIVCTCLVVACGDDDTGTADSADTSETGEVSDAADSAGSSTTEGATVSCVPVTTEPPPGAIDEVTARGKPEVTVPDEPATELVVTDVVVGTGEAVEECDTVVAHYVGVGQQSGEEFDTSWGGEPVPFPLYQVIPGWQQGILGMQVGGRRELIIPAELAYGDNPPAPAIQPGETLVFVVDLVSVVKPPAGSS